MRRDIFCPMNGFILNSGWYGDKWWTSNVPDECTVEDMRRVLSNSLSALQYTILNESQKAELGLVSLYISLSSENILHFDRIFVTHFSLQMWTLNCLPAN